jgi:hypothetical protein
VKLRLFLLAGFAPPTVARDLMSASDRMSAVVVQAVARQLVSR